MGRHSSPLLQKCHLFFFRCAFISSIVVLVIYPFNSWDWFFWSIDAWISIFIVILLHLIFSAFVLTKWTSIWADFVDGILYTGEAIGFGFYARAGYLQDQYSPWATQLEVTNVIFSWTLFAMIIALAISNFISAIMLHFKQQDPSARQRKTGTTMVQGFAVLFGRSMWTTRFIGEGRGILFARAIFAILSLAAIVAYALVRVFAGPIRELSLLPTQAFRTPNNEQPNSSNNAEAATWNVVVTRALSQPTGPIIQYVGPHSDDAGLPVFESLFAAISVIPLWDDSNSPPCVRSVNGTFSDDAGLIPAVVISCPSRNPESSEGLFPSNYQDYQPDLLITVNFTTLGIPPGAMTNMSQNSVQVMIGMTQTLEDVILRSSPTSLIAGVNLIGSATREIRQAFVHPTLSIFGLFETMHTFAVSTIVDLYPDPLASTSPLIVRSPEVSTLRIFIRRDASEWKIVQDNKEKTLLSGLAATGGLWTFLGGIFAAIFGSSIKRVLFGVKPVSVFGIAHSVQRKTIQEAYRKEYPQIKEETDPELPRKGLLHLLHDHIIDLDFLEKEDEHPDSSADQLLPNEHKQSPA